MKGTRPQFRRLLGGGGDALIVVPPFAQTGLGALGPHLLQACAARAGFRVRVLYGSLHFAARLGIDAYDAVCRDAAFVSGFPGERVFARAAHGLPAMGRRADRFQDLDARIGAGPAARLGGLDLIHPPVARRSAAEWGALVEAAEAWIEDFADAIAGLDFPVVGCSTSFDQTNASIAILRALRRRRPDVRTVLGGGNCFGEMAAGVASLDPRGEVVDHVFEGEAEASFVAFLEGLRAGSPPPERVVPGRPAVLDDLPDPAFDDLEAQAAAWLPDGGRPFLEVAAETSRGCYRGEQGHCTFCGLNGTMRAFRRKAPARAAAGIADLSRRHPGRGVFLTDTIVPDGVLGPLAGQGGGARLHLCVGPRIGLRSAARLVAAGVTQVEPGFEALDTSFLDAMNKGATAADVVRSLRNLRSFGIYPHWNVLWALPGEDGEAHARAAARMPLLHHLVPPRVAYHVSIDRACPYHLDPARWGIRDVRRLPSYDDLFPEGADLDRIACHYVGDYGCASFEDPGRVRSLLAAVDDWQAAWQVVPPDLKVVRVGAVWALGDTREATGSPGLRRLSGRDEARRLLADGPLDGSAGQADLLAGGLALALDGQFVPLACAAPDVLEALANPV